MENGSWRFVSEDIFATDSEGRRIHLSPDGQWEIINDAPPGLTPAAVTRPSAPATEPASVLFSLDSAFIETINARPAVSGRTSPRSFQSVFYLDISLASTETQTRNFNLNCNHFSLEDNTRRRYDLVAIRPETLTLQPGESRRMEIRFDSSPALRFGKSYFLSVSAELLQADREQVFSLPLSDIRSVDVDRF